MTRDERTTPCGGAHSANSESFSVPRDGEIFESVVFDRCQDLISSRVWDGIAQHRLQAWLNNFTAAPERYFAACVLDKLIYRSMGQTVAMMWQLFQRTLPDLVRSDPPKGEPNRNWAQALDRARSGDPGIRLVPVIRSGDSPAKSGPLLCRMYRRHLGFNQDWMIWPWKLADAKNQGIGVFVFVDDFLGTGQQFSEFADHFSLANSFAETYAVYAPLVAHSKGVTCLRSRYPDLRVVASEFLDDSHSLFSASATSFSDSVNTRFSAHDLYMKISKDHDLRRTTGFGDLALAYAFEHATPDNCLPILWQTTSNWNPLFER